MPTLSTDPQSETFLRLLSDQEQIKSNKIQGVKTVLVVLSSKAMVYDTESLRQKILLTYADSAVFFQTTDGKPVGVRNPGKVDLLIDLTTPGSRQGLFRAYALKGMAKTSVGRNAGLFRKKIYHRVYDEKPQMAQLPKDLFERERVVQRNVLALAGVALAQKGDLPPDLGQSIALGLPPMQKL